jgi:hypothetical protein
MKDEVHAVGVFRVNHILDIGGNGGAGTACER